MRRWKVTIRRNDETVFRFVADTFGRTEAIERAWDAFDPARKLDLITGRHFTHCQLLLDWDGVAAARPWQAA